MPLVAQYNKRLERTRRLATSIRSSVGEPLKRNVGLLRRKSMSSETESKATLFDFVRYLRKHIYELADSSTPNFTQDEHYKLHGLGGAVEELMIFAQEIGDHELYDILDDFDYAVKECGMGAPSKGKSELDRGAFKLDEYDQKTGKKPAS